MNLEVVTHLGHALSTLAVLALLWRKDRPSPSPAQATPSGTEGPYRTTSVPGPDYPIASELPTREASLREGLLIANEMFKAGKLAAHDYRSVVSDLMNQLSRLEKDRP